MRFGGAPGACRARTDRRAPPCAQPRRLLGLMSANPGEAEHMEVRAGLSGPGKRREPLQTAPGAPRRNRVVTPGRSTLSQAGPRRLNGIPTSKKHPHGGTRPPRHNRVHPGGIRPLGPRRSLWDRALPAGVLLRLSPGCHGSKEVWSGPEPLCASLKGPCRLLEAHARRSETSRGPP